MQCCSLLSPSFLILGLMKTCSRTGSQQSPPLDCSQRIITRSFETVRSQLRISRRSPAAPRGVMRAPRPGWLSYDTSQTRRASGSLVIRSQRGLAPFLPVVSFCSALSWECSEPPRGLSSHPSRHPRFTPSRTSLEVAHLYCGIHLLWKLTLLPVLCPLALLLCVCLPGPVLVGWRALCQVLSGPGLSTS